MFLKNFTSAPIHRARARIFKGPRSESGSDSLGEEQLTTDLSKTKIGGIAKGPVEGSTGFERRRNRRSVMQPQQNDKSQKRSSERNDGALHAPTSDVCKNTGKQAQPHTRPPRAYDYRLRHGYGGLSGSNSNLVPGQHGNGGRRQAGHASNNRNDLQDPDFDRCYDKWAVRPAPASHASQQMQVPVFNQLLSPYSIQPGPQMHAGNVHMRVLNAAGQVQQGVGQYQAMMHQAPSSAMMYGHVGQGVNSGGGEYGEGLRESVGYDMSGADVLSSAHSQGFGHLQNQGLPGQLGRKQSPTYGLDSTVDFPPLP